MVGKVVGADSIVGGWVPGDGGSSQELTGTDAPLQFGWGRRHYSSRFINLAEVEKLGGIRSLVSVYQVGWILNRVLSSAGGDQLLNGFEQWRVATINERK